MYLKNTSLSADRFASRGWELGASESSLGKAKSWQIVRLNDQAWTSSTGRRKKIATTLSVARKACTTGGQRKREQAVVTLSGRRTHPGRHGKVGNLLM